MIQNLKLDNIFTTSKKRKDKIAEILKTTPEALEVFEKAYKAVEDTDHDEDNLFAMNSRQAASESRTGYFPERIDEEQLNKLINSIVDELIEIPKGNYLTDGNTLITNEDIKTVPESLRPQLTGTLYKVDIDEPAYISLLEFYKKAITEKNPKKAKIFYDHFRQGLDILDLDPITYQIIDRNRNSMGYWFPAISAAANAEGFFKIPETKIVKVPLPLLQLTRQDYMSLTPTTLQIVDNWAMRAFELDENKTYFIKTGTYSSKFDFRNAKVTGAKEVRELGEYLLFIHFQALQMASPLSKPTIYGACTTTEWVVREYIEDKENNPCIYHGLPLHTEYRVFVDFDTDEILGINPYWDPEVMKTRFANGSDADTNDMKHDYIIYRAHEETLMSRYEENKGKVLEHIQNMLPDVSLEGQWSVDIMQNGDDFWIIDMATADTSALSSCVPAGKLKKSPEDWLPKLEQAR